MQATMMDYQLTVPAILQRAKDVHPQKEIVTKMNDGSLHRYTYADFYRRTLKLAHALQKIGVRPGDVVATLALNHYRHLELYFAVPSLGAVLHTLNVRLFPEQLVHIINHARDGLLFVDKSLTKLLAEQLDQIGCVKRFVVMDDLDPAEPAKLPHVLDYEELLQGGDEQAAVFPALREDSAAVLCYTSGTTGLPKGVVYSHRSIYLHSMGLCMADSLGVSEKETLLPVAPMFHANAWGIPFAAVMAGSKLVFPGKHLLSGALASLLESEKVTIAAGVSTIWSVLLQHLRKTPHQLCLHTVLIGGSALPRVMIESYQKEFGVKLLQAWGMTELSPFGTICRLRSYMQDWSDEKKYETLSLQGSAAPGVEIRALDDQGKDVPRDGQTPGELIVRGPWVAGGYFQDESGEAFTADGWFRTGDIVTLDEHNYVRITDRKKDLIKTRGEWLASVAMESKILAAPAILEAAVVARPDSVRGETPVVFVVPKEGEEIDKAALMESIRPHFTHWQMPHQADIHVVEALPKTSVGKLDKKALRRRLCDSQT